jgi:flagellar export protein FliJ
MRFQFQLEGLLRVRRLLEQQARERLDESMSTLRSLDHRLAQASEWSRNTACARSTSAPIPAAELQFIESVLLQANMAIADCSRRKQAEEQRAAELRYAYLDARLERKTVDTLRNNALRLFQIEQARHEQSALDEIFLGKLIYSRNAVTHAAKPEPEMNHDRNLT